jgi:ribosomal-protein-alanine N-acetyltransferase
MSVQLAAAGLAAVPVIGALHVECFEDPWSEKSIAEVLASAGVFAFLAHAPSGQPPSAPASVGPAPPAVAAAAAAPGGTGATGLPCGFAIARVTGDDAELLSIGVARAWRRHGIARRLIDAVIAAVERRRVRRLYLEVAEDNPGARALYACYGFVQVGRRDAYYRRQGGSVPALTMCRPVGRSGLSWTAASL